MRFDTHKAGAYLVNSLLDAGAVSEVHHDGNDIILVGMPNGDSVMIYMIERPIARSEVLTTLERNTQLDIYTLFVFWCDMLLPREGSFYRVDDWMDLLLPLYDQKLYGFEVVHGRVWIFPVHFEGEGPIRRIHYGDTLDWAAFGVGQAQTRSDYFEGLLHVADFSQPLETAQARAREAHSKRTHAERPTLSELERSYAVLSVSPGADRATIRAAYRRLAMQYHPDVNPSREATARMQEINVAYMQILAQLDDS